jgi:hypothetical protein
MRSVFIWMLPLCLLFFSCSKTKQDDIPEQPFDQYIKSSTARLVLAGGMDLAVNNTRLSNWLAGDASGGGPALPPNPTPYFPQTGKPGNTYFIPQQFMDHEGKATIALYFAAGSMPVITAEVEDNYAQPWDYYYHLKESSTGSSITKVPRPIVKPSQPQNILIRLVNLASTAVPNSGPDEKLSLAFANGSPVSAVTSGIGKGQWSGYTELPYGTYEFRVLIDGSTSQYPALPPSEGTVTSAEDLTLVNTRLYYTQRRLFQPGGVYTMVVHFNEGKYEIDQAAVKARVNAFSVVTDLSPAANLSYARVQVANAFAEQGITVKIDNQESQQVGYGKAGDYVIVTTGNHTVQVGSAPAQVITVKGGDNLTLWAYPGNSDSLKLLPVQNNMSGIVNRAEHEDGSDGSTSVFDPLTVLSLSLQTRFLNLCPELPQVTFTAKNGAPMVFGNQGYPGATVNLLYGAIPDPVKLPYPYINLGDPWIEAYQSASSVVPGDRITDVTPLTPADFMHMPASFYPNGLPAGEPGVYTVALIGHRNNARLIVIKHNK